MEIQGPTPGFKELGTGGWFWIRGHSSDLRTWPWTLCSDSLLFSWCLLLYFLASADFLPLFPGLSFCYSFCFHNFSYLWLVLINHSHSSFHCLFRFEDCCSICFVSLISERGNLIRPAHFFLKVVSVGSCPMVHLASGQMLVSGNYWLGRWDHMAHTLTQYIRDRKMN